MTKEQQIEQALNLLKENGYYIDHIWHVQDVTDRYECTKEEAMQVLYNVFELENQTFEVFESIKFEAEQMGLKYKNKAQTF